VEHEKDGQTALDRRHGRVGRRCLLDRAAAAAGLETLAATPRMPVLFVGHGSPMNAVEDNEFAAPGRRWERSSARAGRNRS
jgi:4,5-DOPA dioxygenase extradiol